MKHPLEFISIAHRPVLFWSLFACTLLVMLIFNVIGQPLSTAAAPSGIVSLELAGSAEKTQMILDSWDAQAQLLAAFGLGFDYLFMVIYAATLGLACLWARDSLEKHRWPLVQLGVPLAWAALAAALLDAAENVGLLWQLVFGPADSWARIAQLCAWAKFGIIFLALVFAFYAIALQLVGRLSRQPGQ
jgi:hypothetical protein